MKFRFFLYDLKNNECWIEFLPCERKGKEQKGNNRYQIDVTYSNDYGIPMRC